MSKTRQVAAQLWRSSQQPHDVISAWNCNGRGAPLRCLVVSLCSSLARSNLSTPRFLQCTGPFSTTVSAMAASDNRKQMESPQSHPVRSTIAAGRQCQKQGGGTGAVGGGSGGVIANSGMIGSNSHNKESRNQENMHTNNANDDRDNNSSEEMTSRHSIEVCDQTDPNGPSLGDCHCASTSTAEAQRLEGSSSKVLALSSTCPSIPKGALPDKDKSQKAAIAPKKRCALLMNALLRSSKASSWILATAAEMVTAMTSKMHTMCEDECRHCRKKRKSYLPCGLHH